MQKLPILIIACFVFSGRLYSQTATIIKETWGANPVLHELKAGEEKEDAVIISDKRRIEYVDEKENLAEYVTMHRIVHINTDRGIENNNTLHLGISDDGNIIDLKARTLLDNGKVIEIDRKNVKDLTAEDGNQYKIFAFEGLEKGCEVEYLYTFKRDPSFFGREIIQNGYPVHSAEVEIVAPERLVFDTKTYNADITPTDTSYGSKRYVRIRQYDIPGAEEEKYSFYRAGLQRIEYKLSYNTSRSKTERIFTWNELSKRLYSSYGVYTDKEKRKISDFVKKNGWENLENEAEKIIAFENYAKKYFTSRDDISSDDADDLEKILKTKIASNRGMVRLFGSVFSALDIPYQFVLSGDREKYSIDESFENWNNTENPLIYFPNLKKFLSPTQNYYRFPWIDPLWSGTNALFCKTTTIGNFTTAIAEIRKIPMEDYRQTSNNMDVKVSFTPAADSLMIDIEQSFTGYSAPLYRSALLHSSADERKEFLRSFVRFGTNSENIISSKITNEDVGNYAKNIPLKVEAVVKSNELLERAGNKILFKIGLLIGQQVEMYQEKKRMFSMEVQYPHILYRTITVTVPGGYIIKNLKDLKSEKRYLENNIPVIGFVSDFSQEGNKLTVTIKEEYRLSSYPIEIYEQFREIINAAADFNKVVLVLEKR